MLLHYIIWDINPVLLRLGSFGVRWYGLLFALSFLLGRQLWYYFLKKEGKPIGDLEALTLHIVFGTILGARLGHVLFYDFSYFAQHPLEIFLPFSFTPTFKFTGYAGLASHGAAIGILTAMYIYANYAITTHLVPPRLTIKKRTRVGQSYLWVADRMIIVVALAGCLIRIGNFMNSEIWGQPTHSQYGVLFARDVMHRLQSMSSAIDKVEVTKSPSIKPNDSDYQPIDLAISFKYGGFEEALIRRFLEKNVKCLLAEDSYITKHIHEPRNVPLQYSLSKNKRGRPLAHVMTLGIPRHPAQLYEACSCFALFLLLICRWLVKRDQLRPGVILGWFLVIIFGFRIIYEFFKESEVAFETILGPLRVPQVLSIPLVVMGIILLRYGVYNKMHRK